MEMRSRFEIDDEAWAEVEPLIPVQLTAPQIAGPQGGRAVSLLARVARSGSLTGAWARAISAAQLSRRLGPGEADGEPIDRVSARGRRSRRAGPWATSRLQTRP